MQNRRNPALLWHLQQTEYLVFQTRISRATKKAAADRYLSTILRLGSILMATTSHPGCHLILPSWGVCFSPGLCCCFFWRNVPRVLLTHRHLPPQKIASAASSSSSFFSLSSDYSSMLVASTSFLPANVGESLCSVTHACWRGRGGGGEKKQGYQANRS